MDAQKILESLTVGGSEFVDDPEACAEYARGHIADLKNNVKRLVRQRNEVTQKLYHLLDLLAPAPELLELAAGLVGAVQCDKCPERDDCRLFLQDTTYRPLACEAMQERLRELAQALRAAMREEDHVTR